MVRVRVCSFACIVFALYSAACTGDSPAAPTPQPPAAPPAGTAAAVFLTPHTWDLPAVGGSLEITIATTGHIAGNVVAAHVPVTLHASSGTLSSAETRTDATGHARVTWTGTSSATITARAGDVVGTSTIRVAAAAPTPTPPNPTPNPNPSPSPAPTPGPARLVVEIFPSSHGGDASTPITFTPRVYSADGGPVGALTYAWDFESDGRIDSTVAIPIHTFTPRDSVTVTLVVTEAGGRTGGSQVTFAIGASPAPTVTISGSATPASVLVGETVTFAATASSNSSAGPITAFAWTFGAGATPATSTSQTTTAAFATPGTKTVRVTATTGNGTTGTATTTVTVRDHPLLVALASSGTPTVGSVLTFTATTSLGSVAGVTYEWDYQNDGTVDETTGTTPAASQAFNSPGVKTIRVRVTAPDGRTATNVLTLTVS